MVVPENLASPLLSKLIDDFIDCANELRYRVMDLPNPMYEDEGGECIHNEEYGCSWRCIRRHKFDMKYAPTKDEIRHEIMGRVGLALFAVLDGDGEDVTRIEAVTLPIAEFPTAKRSVELKDGPKIT